jgi:hypothetical protein
MSLVPIIYTSLALFFGLLLIVVFISYLSYRSRRNTNPVIAEEIRKQRALIIPPKIILDGTKSRTYIPTPRFESGSQKSAARQLEPIVLPSNYFQKEREVNYNQTRFAQREIKPNNDTNRNSNSYYTRSTHARIEIMNENKKFQRFNAEQFNAHQQFTKKESLARHINDLSQFNLLSFYSDSSSDNDFVAATAIPNHHTL